MRLTDDDLKALARLGSLSEGRVLLKLFEADMETTRALQDSSSEYTQLFRAQGAAQVLTKYMKLING